jgi:hypothetical protein
MIRTPANIFTVTMCRMWDIQDNVILVLRKLICEMD